MKKSFLVVILLVMLVLMVNFSYAMDELTPEPTQELCTFENTPEPTLENTLEPTFEITSEPTFENTPEPTLENTPVKNTGVIIITETLTPEPTSTPELTNTVVNSPIVDKFPDTGENSSDVLILAGITIFCTGMFLFLRRFLRSKSNY